MKKNLLTLMALFLIMPISSQTFQKNFRQNLMNKSDNQLKMSPLLRTVAGKIQPKNSLLYDYQTGNELISKITYDQFGHKISLIDPTNLTNQIEEYDPTGEMLLNKYTESRTQPEANWEKPENYDLSTVLNSSGIRTSILHKDFKTIELNNDGLVTRYEFKTEEGEVADGTQTWKGNQLTGLTMHDISNGEETKFELKNIEMVYSSSELNPYDISYFNYLFGFSGNYFGFNAKGTMSMDDGQAIVAGKLTFSAESERLPNSKLEKQILKGNLSMEGFNLDIYYYIYTPTDMYGSYIFEDIQGPTTFIYTIKMDNSGNMTEQSVDKKEKGTVVESESYLYTWTYDDEGKPLKVETYYKNSAEENENRLISKEEFTEWFPLAEIDRIQTKIAGDILNATLYTLSGTPIRTFTPEELNSTIELPAQGVYLLNIETSKGNIVKKIMK